MKVTKQDLESDITQIIMDAIVDCEEYDVTTEKIMKIVWPIIDYFQIRDTVSDPVYKIDEDNWEAFKIFARLHPVEAYDLSPEGFCKFMKEAGYKMTDKQIKKEIDSSR